MIALVCAVRTSPGKKEGLVSPAGSITAPNRPFHCSVYDFTIYKFKFINGRISWASPLLMCSSSLFLLLSFDSAHRCCYIWKKS